MTNVVLPHQIGWRSRIQALIHYAERRTFEWSQHDCGIFCAKAIEAQIGQCAILDKFEGKYHSAEECNAFIHSLGYVDVQDVFRQHTSGDIPIAQARFGDIVFLPDETHVGIDTCALCLGDRVGVVGLTQYGTVDRSKIIAAYRVGL